jgi:hypothetical protein
MFERGDRLQPNVASFNKGSGKPLSLGLDVLCCGLRMNSRRKGQQDCHAGAEHGGTHEEGPFGEQFQGIIPSSSDRSYRFIVDTNFQAGGPTPSHVSIVSGNRSEMRRRLVRKIEHDFVDIAPAPALRRIIGFDDWMAGRAKMLRRVPIGRFIAAADMPASPADAQMHPWRARLQAFLTTGRARNNVADCRQVSAQYRHARLSIGTTHSPIELGRN